MPAGKATAGAAWRMGFEIATPAAPDAAAGPTAKWGEHEYDDRIVMKTHSTYVVAPGDLSSVTVLSGSSDKVLADTRTSTLTVESATIHGVGSIDGCNCCCLSCSWEVVADVVVLGRARSAGSDSCRFCERLFAYIDPDSEV